MITDTKREMDRHLSRAAASVQNIGAELSREPAPSSKRLAVLADKIEEAVKDLRVAAEWQG